MDERTIRKGQWRAGVLLLLLAVGVSAVGCGGSGTSPTAPSTGNLTGSWTGTAHSSVTSVQLNIGAKITQSGADVSGTYSCTSGLCAFGAGTITGTMSGDRFTGRVDQTGGVITCGSFSGTLAGTTLSGTYSCSYGDAGTWTMSKN
jgi:hypothetical protein